MELIQNIVQQGFSFIVSTTILLGLLIFIHELGHFLVAKYFKVRVEVFSLGFGPKIFKFTRGETVYCLSAIPFGGYVKMFGDSIHADIPEAERSASFLHKPIPQRIAIALAGPLMNLIFAVILFFAIANIGYRIVQPVVGDVFTNSDAYKAGFRSGDHIKTINGKKISQWSQVAKLIQTAKPLKIEINRAGHLTNLNVQPQLNKNLNPLINKDQVGGVAGLSPVFNLPIITSSNPQSLWWSLGLQQSDILTKWDEVEVSSLFTLKNTLAKISPGVHKISYMRLDPKTKKYLPTEISIELKDEQAAQLTADLETSETFVSEVTKDSPAQKAGIRKYDKITSINGALILSFEDIIAGVNNFKKEDKSLAVEISRQGKKLSINIEPMQIKHTDQFMNEKTRYAIGIRPLKGAFTSPGIKTADSTYEAITWGLEQTYEWTEMTLVSFAKLLTNKVSPKNLGGFISISQMAQRSWDVGASAFLKIMAILSINLFILNLLPVPILDGGHILFFLIEAIKGSPISIKKLQVFQTVGLFAILFLMVFSLFNDITRIFGS